MLYEVDPKTKKLNLNLNWIIVNNLNNLLRSFSDLRICTHVDFFFFFVDKRLLLRSLVLFTFRYTI